MNADYNFQTTISVYAQSTPQKLAIQYGDETITYQVLELKIRSLSKQLQIGGVRKGDIVAICSSTV